MARGELVKKLFASFGRDDEVRAVALQIIDEEEKKNNKVLARSLRLSLEASSSPRPRPSRLQPIPAAKGAAPETIFDEITPERRLSEIILSCQNRDLVQGIIEETRRSDELLRHSLPIKRRLLFCGPPGCGKSVCAEVIAREIGFPLIVARLDGLVSSFLGETAANLRKLFDLVSNRPVVLLLDEFDALARSRLDNAEHGEVRRVVNALLLMMDRFPNQGLLIAATNLEATIDPAMWRRFDEIGIFGKPDAEGIESMLRLKFKNFSANFDLAQKVAKLADFSFAEIERLSYDAIKRAVLKRQKAVTERDFEAALREERRRRAVASQLIAQDR
jgi:SpoVK/Ycf46/Vps4 family AAA+-type ATPase